MHFVLLIARCKELQNTSIGHTTLHRSKYDVSLLYDIGILDVPKSLVNRVYFHVL